MADLVAGSHAARSTLGGSPFPPIADYGFLSDCEVSALVAPGAGWFRLGPAEVVVPSGRRYLPGTMVLETTWGTPTGWAVVRDVLLVGPWRHGSGRSETHQRAPVDHSAERVLLRTVRCLQGTVDFVLPPSAHQRGHPPDPRRRNGPIQLLRGDPRRRRT